MESYFTSLLVTLGFLNAIFNTECFVVKKYADLHLKEDEAIGCMQMTSQPGQYWYSSEGTKQVCGLYMIGEVDHIIEIEFLYFDIQCDTGGLLETVDGWKLQGQDFPSEMDHPVPIKNRIQDYCGKRKPFKRIISHQNVALIQFLIPAMGEGFVIKVSFHKNPEPCNAISMLGQGEITVSNHGKHANCSVTILYPVVVDLVNINVGATPETPSRNLNEVGTILKCESSNKRDFVELKDGSGLDPMYMYREIDFCGLDSNPVNMRWLLGCDISAVRLVSSGEYYNSVTIKYRPLNDVEKMMAEQLAC